MKNFKALLLASAIIFAATPAHATKTVTSPYVTKGKLEAKWKGGLTHDDDSSSKDGAWEQKATVEYGVTDRFLVEAEAGIANAGNSDNTKWKSFAVKGKMEITEQGEFWVDTGVRLTYDANLDDGADSVEAKLLLAKDIGKFHNRANIILEREVGDDSEDETQFGVSASSRYKLVDALEPGIELYSEFGSLSESTDFDDEDHRIGPVVYGKMGSFKYEAGYLIGISDAATDGTLKAIFAYEWKL